MEVWRIFSLRSPETFHVQSAPLRPLFVKELWETLSGRALWIMLLLMCPLVGYSFFQPVSLYGEASAAGLQSPVLASTLSPLDGILVPTLGAFYVAVTLLFPFVAIRVLGQEKESGALRLLVQLPYRSPTLITAKLAAVLTAWLLASIPALTALVMWELLGGHLSAPETLNLVCGHLLYGLLVGAIALFAASVSESAATAAIVTLAFTIGSWPGVRLRNKVIRSIVCVFAVALALGLVTQIRLTFDVTEDRRNSFPIADQHLLATLPQPLVVTVHLAPEDPRYTDLQRNVLAKLERTMPMVSVRLAGERQSLATNAGSDRYGEVEYAYGGRSDVSRSTSPREILPMLYGLAGVSTPAPAPGSDYPGYPLVAGSQSALFWFFFGLPLCIALAWWWSRRLPKPTAT
jgi:ABC-2 type transport system permease protein